MLQIKSEIASSLSALMSSGFGEDIPASELTAMLEYPPDSMMEDIAFPCFKLSKRLRRSPVMIADTLAQSFSCPCVLSCSSKSGYLNFKISQGALSEKLDKILSGQEYWTSNEGDGKTVVIDYSAPNIAKPFHIGHLRSTVIGASIKRLLEAQGYKVIGINHLGDWGTQFGRQMVAYKRWGVREDIDNRGIAALVELYVRFHKELDNEPSLADEARAWFTKLEQGDNEAVELWKWFNDISMREMRSIYKRLGVDFEYYTGESFYTDKMPEIVEMLRDKNLLKEDDGAMLVDLEQFSMPPCLILKRDGSTLYPTRDIAAAFYRKRTFDFDKAIYVTAAPQNLHFAQWFKVIELMGEDWAKDLIHVPFGMVSVMGSKMSTREGNMLLLEDIINTSVDKVRALIEQKNPNLENKDEVAEMVGLGAIIFNDLSNNRIRDIDFNWDEALNFEGNTGPYVQYTYARTCSVLSKAEASHTPRAEISHEAERTLAITLSLYPERIAQAARELEPSIISRYLLDLCADFNRFYHDCPILKAEDDVKALRLSLTKAAGQVLDSGLELIGLARPKAI